MGQNQSNRRNELKIQRFMRSHYKYIRKTLLRINFELMTGLSPRQLHDYTENQIERLRDLLRITMMYDDDVEAIQREADKLGPLQCPVSPNPVEVYIEGKKELSLGRWLMIQAIMSSDVPAETKRLVALKAKDPKFGEL